MYYVSNRLFSLMWGGGWHNVDSYLDFFQIFKCTYSFIYATSTNKA